MRDSMQGAAPESHERCSARGLEDVRGYRFIQAISQPTRAMLMHSSCVQPHLNGGAWLQYTWIEAPSSGAQLHL